MAAKLHTGTKPWYEPLVHALRATTFLLAHTFLAFVLATIFELMNRWLAFIAGGKEILLFDRVPLRYLFDAMDTGIFLVFLWYGLLSAIKAFRD